MELSDKKLSVIERLMKVKHESTLNEIEKILIQTELESRAKASSEAIENNDTISLDEFSKKNQSWLRKNATR